MLRNVAEPGDAEGLKRDGVDATVDGPVNDALFLLVEQCNNLPLRPDRALQFPICPVQKLHNCCLLIGRGNCNRHSLEVREIEILAKARAITVDSLAGVPDIEKLETEVRTVADVHTLCKVGRCDYPAIP